MIERREFPALPPPERHAAYTAWLRHHTVDPDRVSMPAWIERDEEARRICYSTWLFIIDPDAPTPPDGDWPLVTEMVQLESVPSPFPD